MQTRPDRRQFSGPALLSFGFRPFFLLAGLFAVLAIGLWLPEYEGEITLRTAFSPLAWHAHEMLYGYLAAAATGFLLTAIPNWTGRLPFRGPPLAWLARPLDRRAHRGVGVGGDRMAVRDAGRLRLSAHRLRRDPA